ncbi:ATP-dependent DNA helicase RecQ [Cytobacillus purgationiresistens]|uniref:ATP-dependent DNA helicase RecQ n=2 Tax=Cytobacillus purgationiresistens TaxID=863449 RepID=A0ABU0AK72_9BACI|nr:RecQ family ATP-dependent DNA helicase [Cytobacillus purgationiresistens]MDQ0271116.1 ATP-dependent DNA helicase RecQ [Cytobacillus purgationiresistens]
MMEKMLRKIFGHSTFRPGQRETIASLMSGEHTISMLPTGTGKSLCYQLPGYMLNGSVIIVSPLLSLMQDQVEQLMMLGEKKVIAFNSFLSYEEKNRALHQLHDYKFIFISPEMLKVDLVIKNLKRLDIALFVIDEAHCISQWGYDFRPDYLKLGEVRESLGNPLTLALTATATHKVKIDIIESLSISHPNEFIYSVDRPNIALKVDRVEHHKDKVDKLIEYLRVVKGPGIVYFSSKKMAEQMAALLKKEGLGEVMAYHGGIDQENRKLIQQQFLYGQLDIICATSAFGMGINKNNIRFVVHFHMPMQLESYLQEIGRAGRDGERSLAILLYANGDEQLPIQLAEGELLHENQIDWMIKWLEANPEAWNKLNDYETEMITLAGLTETNWRILKDFHQVAVDSGKDMYSLHELKDVMLKQMDVKRHKIKIVYDWIHFQSCRRKKILQYFDEEQKIRVDNCCDPCGLSIEDFMRNPTMVKNRNEETDWQRLLAEILINK